MLRRNNGLTKLYIFTILTGLALWSGLGWYDCVGEKYGYDPFFITENYFDDLYESCPTFSDLRKLKNIIDRILEVEDKHD